jgi:hypothetical protein
MEAYEKMHEDYAKQKICPRVFGEGNPYYDQIQQMITKGEYVPTTSLPVWII